MPADRRTKLLSAAAELFTTRPYDEVTTTAIAQRAGVAYGLLSHHFSNKRGIYLAVVQAAIDDLSTVRDQPVDGKTPGQQLRNGLVRHIDYVEQNRAGFTTILTAAIGADAQVREMVEASRWAGALRILDGIGITPPIAPAVRSTMRAWVAFFDELILDYLAKADVPKDAVVEIAATTLEGAIERARRIG
jgi:AcrR family transcriptional regulator